ncbi:MAG: response regulator transcription factor [Xanthomonadaceae bacterium]|jgi:DNA-binding response OmpR family regulator|nr:response regulator transcription factor [Xanthomonadaceae bacterium]
MRLLIVEDSVPLSQALLDSLAREGYICDHAADGEIALEYLSRYPYDLVVLDLMLPKRSGFEVLRDIRALDANPNVLILSARDQIKDRVAALDAGADDYLVKPFALDELLARLRALGRRSPQEAPAVMTRGDLEIDPRSRRVRWRGQDLGLTPKEYGLLELLLRHPGQVFSRPQIFERLYDSNSGASDKVIEVIVSTLRGKLGKFGAGDLIQTRRGFGYVLE